MSEHDSEDSPRLLQRWQVAKMLAVNPETVARWGRAGKIRSVTLPGGHLRYFEDDVRAILNPVDTQVHTGIRTEK